MQLEVTEEIARRVIETVDLGLSHGVGQPLPGKMCVEAAVCYAYGLPHGDNPPCVSPTVRSFKIELNDSGVWLNNESRARGLRRVAVAQLGSISINEHDFIEHLTVGITQKILSKSIENYIENHGEVRDHLSPYVEACKSVSTLSDVSIVAEGVCKTLAALDLMSHHMYSSSKLIILAHLTLNDESYLRPTTSAAIQLANAAYQLRYEFSENEEASVREAAEIAVQALIACGAEGTRYLSLCDAN